MEECPTECGAPVLPSFFAGREVFITGATGFVGKVLVERLLSTCPGVERLHLLIRDRRGQTPQKRLAQLKNSQVFDNIRAHCPSQLDKLVVVTGDIAKPQFGLDPYAIADLKKVSVVFNNAAKVNLRQPLREAVSQNVQSAINLMDVCDKLPALQALVHVSTAYVHPELGLIEERVYEMPVQLSQFFNELDTSPEELHHSTQKILEHKMNTYLFTKALAETVIAQRPCRRYAATIFRPSIVISSHRSPFPGWIQGLYGPTGCIVATGQGLMRVYHADGNCRADLVPVDVVTDNMLAVAWQTATDKAAEVRVYYCGSQENPLTWGQFRNYMHRSQVLHPMENVLYYPYLITLQNRYLYKVCEVLLQTVPLYVVELINKLCAIEKRINFITVAKRLITVTSLLGYFTCHEFTFSSDNMRSLRERLRTTDGHLFNLDIRDVEWKEHILNFQRGARKHLLGQKDESLPRSKMHVNRLRLLHCALQLALAMGLGLCLGLGVVSALGLALLTIVPFVFVTQKLA